MGRWDIEEMRVREKAGGKEGEGEGNVHTTLVVTVCSTTLDILYSSAQYSTEQMWFSSLQMLTCLWAGRFQAPFFLTSSFQSSLIFSNSLTFFPQQFPLKVKYNHYKSFILTSRGWNSLGIFAVPLRMPFVSNLGSICSVQ